MSSESTRPLPEPDLLDSLEELAFAAVGMTALALNEAGRSKELTLAQWRVLVILGRGPVRVGLVADRLAISLPSASRLVDRMEAHGLVEASRDGRDRRVMQVSLTALGRSTREGVIERRRRLIDEAVGSRGEFADMDLGPGLALLAERLASFS